MGSLLSFFKINLAKKFYLACSPVPHGYFCCQEFGGILFLVRLSFIVFFLIEILFEIFTQ